MLSRLLLLLPNGFQNKYTFIPSIYHRPGSSATWARGNLTLLPWGNSATSRGILSGGSIFPPCDLAGLGIVAPGLRVLTHSLQQIKPNKITTRTPSGIPTPRPIFIPRFPLEEELDDFVVPVAVDGDPATTLETGDEPAEADACVTVTVFVFRVLTDTTVEVDAAPIWTA
jgi:hypothetical protein